MPRIGICSVCKKGDLTVHKNRVSGLLWCRGCASKKEKCAQCGKLRPANRRTRHGDSICGWCDFTRKAKEPCSQCGKLAVLNRSRLDAKAICRNCNRARASFQCGVCKKERSGYPQTTGSDGKRICKNCVSATVSFPCGICEKVRRGFPARRVNGTAICYTCVSRFKKGNTEVPIENPQGK